jgi:PAS domain-containing protein
LFRKKGDASPQADSMVSMDFGGAAPPAAGGGRFAEPAETRMIGQELSMLRDILAKVPLPIWMEQADGKTVWCNLEYLARIRKRVSETAQSVWPLPPLTTAPVGDGQRLELGSDETGTEWLETSVCQTHKGRVIYGIPITRLVQAETTLNDFTQTLAKSFAHLPIGLAIFDRQRRLALFNPAMPDLTTLPVEFLACRPTLSDCLDRMRELQMLPEPKDYRSWRRRMAEIEKEASAGLYEDIWYLPGAQTFRVIGRPLPDGALALLFEDITTETARTRRHRADIELGQSVLDQMDEAVAVFSPAGLLVMSNAAYIALWGHDPSGFVGAESTILAIASHWRGQTAPTQLWFRAETFVATLGDRKAWSAGARLRDGRPVTCRFIPLSGGSTMISFRVAAGRPRRISVAQKDAAPQLA